MSPGAEADENTHRQALERLQRRDHRAVGSFPVRDNDDQGLLRATT